MLVTSKMDFRGRRHERGSNWTDPEIVELLQLWSDDSVQIELESSLRNSRVFDRIAHLLRDKGIYRTGDQCREKIKKMKLEYRRIKDNHKMRLWKFYDVMDRVLANRPAVNYSSLGGAVVAQQVFHSPDTDTQVAGPTGSFGPASSGGFLFGPPPKPRDLLDIKCEDVDQSMLNSGVAPPEMYYGSGDDQEADGQSLLGPDNIPGRGESSTNPIMSPSGFSEMNIAGSATASPQAAASPVGQDWSERPGKAGPPPLANGRQRKRRRGGKASSLGQQGGARCGHQPYQQGCLDKVLAGFLRWQQSAEERLLSLEEARLDKELQAEERREQAEDRRAERERQHELRLFSMLTGVLASVRRADPPDVTAAPTTTDASLSPPAHLSKPQIDAAANSPVSQPHSETPTAAKTAKSPAAVNVCKTPLSDFPAATTAAGSPSNSVYLSDRGNSMRQHQGLLQDGFTQYTADRHHQTENPDGTINLGTSENKLCYDILHKRLTKPDMLHVDPSLMEYSDWRGRTFLREEVAKFLTHYCHSPNPLKTDNVVVMNGCCSLFSCIAAAICDPKDAILIPTPFYGVITEDVHLYSDVKLFHVPLECEANGKDSQPFHLTVRKLEEGLKLAKQEGLIIRAVILMNPHNPLAEIYTPKEMIAFLEFAKRYELHVIVDEVYMLTVFDESVTFHSVLSIESLPDPQRTHVMWGLSKDFAMSGMRIGTLYTENSHLVDALAKLGAFHGLPGITQHQVAQLLKDREWISKEFLPKNRCRLKDAHEYLTGELQSMGIPYLHGSAALYVWADLRKFLLEWSAEEEMSLWRRFLRHKVLLSCGQAFSCSTPGWFRLVFSVPQHSLQQGVKRIRDALKEIERESPRPDTHSIQQSECTENEKSVKDDRPESDNAPVVNSTSLTQNESSDQLKDKHSPVPCTDSLLTDDLVLLDCQTQKPTEGLDSLIGTLRQQMHSSDWLEKNTPKLSAEEDPEILDVFKALLQRARK